MSYILNSVNPDAPSNEVGLVIKTGGEVSYAAMTADVLLSQYTNFIHVGQGGTLIVEGINGQPIIFYNLLDSEWVPVVTNKVLYQATFNEVVRTTTAEQITWYGGQ